MPEFMVFILWDLVTKVIKSGYTSHIDGELEIFLQLMDSANTRRDLV